MAWPRAAEGRLTGGRRWLSRASRSLRSAPAAATPSRPILEQAGLLERFYTDLCGDLGWGRQIARARFVPGLRPSLSRLAGRRLPDATRRLTRTFDWPACRHALRAARTHADAAAAFRAQLSFSDSLGRAMARAGYGAATHLYSMLGECGPFLAEGHRRGLTVVADVYILLSTDQLLAEERRAFPGWEPDVPDYAAIRRQAGRERILLTRSHHFICPSPAVQDDLVANFGIARERSSLVPYGVDPRWLALAPRPVRGRVLFAGAAGLRKGIHYLALAAQRLRTRSHAYEFRVAGGVAPTVAQQPLCRNLDFLGRVPRDRIHEELAAADVFVLPSLAEGSAGATYEALAAGVPVVTTPAAGSVVRDGIEGRIVPERDPVALADAIAEIVEDRDKRARMSIAARERARDYTWDRYGERLVGILRSLSHSTSDGRR